MKPYGGKRKARCPVKGHGTRCGVAKDIAHEQVTDPGRKKRARREAIREINRAVAEMIERSLTPDQRACRDKGLI